MTLSTDTSISEKQSLKRDLNNEELNSWKERVTFLTKEPSTKYVLFMMITTIFSASVQSYLLDCLLFSEIPQY